MKGRRRAALLALLTVGALAVIGVAPAAACSAVFIDCPATGLTDGSATVGFAGAGVADLVSGRGAAAIDYVWRLVDPCVLDDQRITACRGIDFRACPGPAGRVIGLFAIQRRLVVRPDGTQAVGVAPAGTAPGTQVGPWETVRQGCIDITSLNPPPTPAEVFSEFRRLPLPQLTTQHQPPGNGLSGLPVIFWTDSAPSQTFTVDIRGFRVAITATVQRYTWHTGDPARPTVTSTDPGRPSPDQTVTHLYRSGHYTASLTVTWGATFSVNGGPPDAVPGSTTTDGPPVDFDVLQARAVLTNPYD